MTVSVPAGGNFEINFFLANVIKLQGSPVNHTMLKHATLIFKQNKPKQNGLYRSRVLVAAISGGDRNARSVCNVQNLL